MEPAGLVLIALVAGNALIWPIVCRSRLRRTYWMRLQTRVQHHDAEVVRLIR